VSGSRTAERFVDIRPGVNVLSLFPHLNYKAWFALAEFVDNALQSSLTSARELRATDPSYRLKVNIDVSVGSPHSITVADNAAGIAGADFERALRAAALPPDRTGLSEFGVGMKSAAFWFAPRWSLRTSALGEPIEREITFNLQAIVDGNQEQLPVIERRAVTSEHYTEITLYDVHQLVSGPRTIGKIRSHLASIYRRFIAAGQLLLKYNGTALEYLPPSILVAAPYNQLDAEMVVWRKDIEFDFGLGVTVSGFAAIRQTGSTKEAGFSLFRRDRLIQGGADEPYRPTELFGAANKFASQRIFGELNFEGIDVTHTKDGFKWDEGEAAFLDLLRDYLREAPLNLPAQAEHYRVGRTLSAGDNNVSASLDAATSSLSPEILAEAADAIAADVLSPAIEAAVVEDMQPPEGTAGHTIRREFEFYVDGGPLTIALLVDDRSRPRDLYDVLLPTDDQRVATVKLYLNHPFLIRHVGPNSESLDAIFELLAALALSEIVARRAGVAFAGAVRRSMNRLLAEHHQVR
jgi:Histidine kinase-, DNA gyrase B-, and HSP90-like ATPase